MPRQKQLLFEGDDCLDALWEQFPKDARKCCVTLYAQLIVKAAEKDFLITNKPEKSDDDEQRGR